jgi:IS30 family transposase
VDFYFAKPYHSWQKGANENLNGLVRQYFPKKTDFTLITEAQVEKGTNIFNNRPRKRHQYKSPNEVFASSLDNQTQFALIT